MKPHRAPIPFTRRDFLGRTTTTFASGLTMTFAGLPNGELRLKSRPMRKPWHL